MSRVFVIIIVMALVTYIPRVIPFVTISEKALPKKIKLFLEFVPFTALGALIIPGVFSAIEGNVLASLVGVSFAFIYSWKRDSMIISVIGSILVVYIIMMVV